MPVAQAPLPKAIILVDPISSGIPLREACRRLNYLPVAAISMRRELITTRWKNYAPYLKGSVQDSGFEQILWGETLEALESQIRALPYHVVAIVAASEQGVIMADQLAKLFSLKCNDPGKILARRNKAEMRRVFTHHGVSSPEYRECFSLAEAKVFMTGRAFPVVVKPPESSGSEMVCVCKSLDDLTRAVFNVLNTKTGYGEVSTSFLIEEYIGGDEYVVNLLGDGENVNVTDVWKYNKETWAHNQPVYQDVILIKERGKIESALIATAHAAADALGISFGQVHAEIKYFRGKAYVIEVAARPCGAKIPSLIEQTSGLPLYELTIKAYVSGNAAVEKNIELKKHIWIAMFPQKAGGVLRQVKGIAEVESLPSFHSLALSAKVGEALPATKDLFDIPLTIWFTHENEEQLKNDVHFARTHLQFLLQGKFSNQPIAFQSDEMNAVSADF